MAMRHRAYAIYGIQFHPESILTLDGRTILSNWLYGKPQDPPAPVLSSDTE